MDASRLELLTRIASMYFEDGMTQKEIADETGYSRSMVSRLLTEARQQRLVEIHIYHPLERCNDLEQELQQHFGLKMARVVAASAVNQYMSAEPLGALAARIIEDLAHDGMTLGVSWGRTVLQTINAIRPRALSDVHVVQVVGLLGTADPQIDGHELARRLARAFGGTYWVLPAPLFVEDEITRSALLADQRVRRVLDSAQRAEVALLGIGTTEVAHCTLFHDGYLTEANLRSLIAAGTVGDVCCNFLDENGESPNVPLAQRVVGIDRERLKAIPTKIAVAGGAPKIKPILAAIRAGLVNILVTDEIAACGVLRLANAPGCEELPAMTRDRAIRGGARALHDR